MKSSNYSIIRTKQLVPLHKSHVSYTCIKYSIEHFTTFDSKTHLNYSLISLTFHSREARCTMPLLFKIQKLAGSSILAKVINEQIQDKCKEYLIKTPFSHHYLLVRYLSVTCRLHPYHLGDYITCLLQNLPRIEII